jgi:hypothetical protein
MKSEKRDKKYNKKVESATNKKSILGLFPITPKLSLAVALKPELWPRKIFSFSLALLLMAALFVSAGDVIIDSGKLNVSNNFYIDENGNVGIGLTSPQRLLHIEAQQDANIRLEDSTASHAAYIEFYGSGTRYGWVGLPGDTTDYIELASDNGANLVLSPAGNVGIGTLSPQKKLQVVGDINASGDICTDLNGGKCLSNLGTYTDSDWIITGNDMYSGVSGKVGIGTASPYNILHVHSSSTQGTIGISGVSDDGHTYSALYLHDDTADAYNNWVIGHKREVGTNYEDDLWIGRWIDPATYRTDMVIDSVTGNVGIGTTNPEATLHIKGSTRGPDAVLAIDRDSTTSGDSSIGFYTAGSPAWRIGMDDDGTNNLYIGEETIIRETTIMTFLTNGNVGIGTTQPVAKLEVANVIRLTPTDTPGTCNSNMEGALYYDASIGQLCFCDGVSWLTVGGLSSMLCQGQGVD